MLTWSRLKKRSIYVLAKLGDLIEFSTNILLSPIFYIGKIVVRKIGATNRLFRDVRWHIKNFFYGKVRLIKRSLSRIWYNYKLFCFGLERFIKRHFVLRIIYYFIKYLVWVPLKNIILLFFRPIRRFVRRIRRFYRGIVNRIKGTTPSAFERMRLKLALRKRVRRIPYEEHVRIKRSIQKALVLYGKHTFKKVKLRDIVLGKPLKGQMSNGITSKERTILRDYRSKRMFRMNHLLGPKNYKEASDGVSKLSLIKVIFRNPVSGEFSARIGETRISESNKVYVMAPMLRPQNSMVGMNVRGLAFPTQRPYKTWVTESFELRLPREKQNYVGDQDSEVRKHLGVCVFDHFIDRERRKGNFVFTVQKYAPDISKRTYNLRSMMRLNILEPDFYEEKGDMYFKLLGRMVLPLRDECLKDRYRLRLLLAKRFKRLYILPIDEKVRDLARGVTGNFMQDYINSRLKFWSPTAEHNTGHGRLVVIDGSTAHALVFFNLDEEISIGDPETEIHSVYVLKEKDTAEKDLIVVDQSLGRDKTYWRRQSEIVAEAAEEIAYLQESLFRQYGMVDLDYDGLSAFKINISFNLRARIASINWTRVVQTLCRSGVVFMFYVYVFGMFYTHIATLCKFGYSMEIAALSRIIYSPDDVRFSVKRYPIVDKNRVSVVENIYSFTRKCKSGLSTPFFGAERELHFKHSGIRVMRYVRTRMFDPIKVKMKERKDSILKQMLIREIVLIKSKHKLFIAKYPAYSRLCNLLYKDYMFHYNRISKVLFFIYDNIINNIYIFFYNIYRSIINGCVTLANNFCRMIWFLYDRLLRPIFERTIFKVYEKYMKESVDMWFNAFRVSRPYIKPYFIKMYKYGLANFLKYIYDSLLNLINYAKSRGWSKIEFICRNLIRYFLENAYHNTYSEVYKGFFHTRRRWKFDPFVKNKIDTRFKINSIWDAYDDIYGGGGIGWWSSDQRGDWVELTTIAVVLVFFPLTVILMTTGYYALRHENDWLWSNEEELRELDNGAYHVWIDMARFRRQRMPIRHPLWLIRFYYNFTLRIRLFMHRISISRRIGRIKHYFDEKYVRFSRFLFGRLKWVIKSIFKLSYGFMKMSVKVLISCLRKVFAVTIIYLGKLAAKVGSMIAGLGNK